MRPATLPPTDHVRAATRFDWCDCSTGMASLSFSPKGSNVSSIVPANVTTTFTYPTATSSVEWTCKDARRKHTTAIEPASAVWTVQLTVRHRSERCTAGRIKWNTWQPVAYRVSYPFQSFADDYACMKIPVLLRTSSGALLVFAEARKLNCSDFARTDLVMKRSADDGQSWSPITRVIEPGSTEGLCGNPLVVGNAAPVQLSAASRQHPGRILVPHMRNNFAPWMIHSDDDGHTWSSPTPIPNVTRAAPSGPDCDRNMSYLGVTNASSFVEWVRSLAWSQGVDPYVRWREQLSGPWQFVGLGPPGALQLRPAGRILVPGYHSYVRGLDVHHGGPPPVSQLYNNLALGHVLMSDDDGDSWRLGSAFGYGDGHGAGANEAQLVELRNGSILLNSRSLSTGSRQLRVQAISHDGGETFSSTSFVEGLPEPFGGCEGSAIAMRDGTVLVSHPRPQQNRALLPALLTKSGSTLNLTSRDHMTVWSSADGGASYQPRSLIDEGAAGYSSMQLGEGDDVWILYEQSDPPARTPAEMAEDAVIGSIAVQDPDRFVLRRFRL